MEKAIEILKEVSEYINRSEELPVVLKAKIEKYLNEYGNS